VWDGGVEWNYLLVDLRNPNPEQSTKLLQLAGLLTVSNGTMVRRTLHVPCFYECFRSKCKPIVAVCIAYMKQGARNAFRPGQRGA
jgi:hypothetical protein